MAGDTVVVQADPSIAGLVLDNRERVVRLEGRVETLEHKVDKALILVEELHADMIGRRAVIGIASRLSRYVAWILAGLGALLGIDNSDQAIHWLKTFPGAAH